MSDDYTRDKPWLAEKMEDPETRVAFALEWASFRFCQQVEEALEAQKLSRADLAKQLNVSRAAITQALSEGQARNFTLETMAKYAVALGFELEVSLRSSNDASEPATAEEQTAPVYTTEFPCSAWISVGAAVVNPQARPANFDWRRSITRTTKHGYVSRHSIYGYAGEDLGIAGSTHGLIGYDESSEDGWVIS